LIEQLRSMGRINGLCRRVLLACQLAPDIGALDMPPDELQTLVVRKAETIDGVDRWRPESSGPAVLFVTAT